MIPRSQIIGCLRDDNFSYNERGKRTEILRQHGSGVLVAVPLRDTFTPQEAGIILAQAGFSKQRVEKFLKDCLKV